MGKLWVAHNYHHFRVIKYYLLLITLICAQYSASAYKAAIHHHLRFSLIKYYKALANSSNDNDSFAYGGFREIITVQLITD